jgi:hypothetical protein
MLKVFPYGNFALYWDIEIDVMIGIMVRLSCGGNNHPKNNNFFSNYRVACNDMTLIAPQNSQRIEIVVVIPEKKFVSLF